MKTRLEEHYLTAVRPALIEKFGYSNVMQAPKLEKIVINMGVGEAVRDSKKVEHAARELAAISGQKPVITRSKKANAAFKLREGMPIGCKVTLRREHMYEFLDRLVNIALPRVRDFRGLTGKALTARAIMPWASKSRSFFQRLITIRSMKFAAWILSLLLRRIRMKKRVSYSPPSSFRSSKLKSKGV